MIAIEELLVGDGPEVEDESVVVVDFVCGEERGRLQFEVGLGDVIAGLEAGVVGMRVGGRRRVEIPPELAYGSRGAPIVPPDATLVFELALVSVR